MGVSSFECEGSRGMIQKDGVHAFGFHSASRRADTIGSGSRDANLEANWRTAVAQGRPPADGNAKRPFANFALKNL